MCSLGRNDEEEDDKKRRSSFGAKMAAMVGLGKKSQSTSQLDPEGEDKLLILLSSSSSTVVVLVLFFILRWNCFRSSSWWVRSSKQ